MPHILTPATCVTFAVNYTQARATFTFFIFYKLKFWAWSLHTIPKTGLGSRFSVDGLISVRRCKEGRSVGGSVYVRFAVAAVAVRKSEAGQSVHQLHLRGQLPEAFRSYPILTSLTSQTFWSTAEWPPLFSAWASFFPHRNSISSSSALTILQPVEGLKKKRCL